MRIKEITMTTEELALAEEELKKLEMLILGDKLQALNLASLLGQEQELFKQWEKCFNKSQENYLACLVNQQKETAEFVQKHNSWLKENWAAQFEQTVCMAVTLLMWNNSQCLCFDELQSRRLKNAKDKFFKVNCFGVIKIQLPRMEDNMEQNSEGNVIRGFFGKE